MLFAAPVLGSHQPAGGNGNLLVPLKPAEMLWKQLGSFHRSHKNTVNCVAVLLLLSECCPSEGFTVSVPGMIQAVSME